ncbi:hypothetical protein FGO68_gene9771 [Halteria grandinella]|uniref:Uncharacterized protein n=1 Tax=Halteria grandinella TaxID=5974 RepID=A0A8J8NKR6_HALGN|nr:hypothetical protein FGO68_gene9771 [Halteria grandinella]
MSNLLNPLLLISVKKAKQKSLISLIFTCKLALRNSSALVVISITTLRVDHLIISLAVKSMYAQLVHKKIGIAVMQMENTHIYKIKQSSNYLRVKQLEIYSFANVANSHQQINIAGNTKISCAQNVWSNSVSIITQIGRKQKGSIQKRLGKLFIIGQSHGLLKALSRLEILSKIRKASTQTKT